MSAPLAPHIHLAALGDDVVLLDVRADAYLCVPDGLAQLRPSSDRTSVSPADAETLEELAAAGFVAAASRGRLRPPRLPRDDLGDVEPVTLRARESVRLMACLWDFLWRYRRRSLDSIVAFAAAAPANPPGSSAEVIRLARLFHRAAIWLPIPGKCLARSFVLLRFLQRSGLNAQWVFGVRTWPFRAHCWLQLGDVALDDGAERLAAFEPIFVVG